MKHAIIPDIRKCYICRDVCLNKLFNPINIKIFSQLEKDKKLCMMYKIDLYLIHEVFEICEPFSSNNDINVETAFRL